MNKMNFKMVSGIVPILIFLLISNACGQEEIPDSVRIYAERGVQYISEEEYQKAINEFNIFMNYVPDDPGVLYYIGLCYGKLENYQKAISYFKKTTEKLPGAAQAYLNWGGCLTKLYAEKKDSKMLDDAISLYQKAININPSLADAYYNLSSALIHKWRETDDLRFIEKARDQALKAVEMIPDQGYFYYNVACAEGLLGNLNEMLSALQIAIESDPSFKRIAREDQDFGEYYNQSDFIELTSD
jgi:tetratricopeptide (TPR) repeat protein